ncbi:MAG: binding-protein-dependent transport system inner rane component [Anaerocolumna sp.]|jgi:oligogalacturonide transport system permease protein|nr:binding-protein-dependent transport system inner rane component [Anaerocolumna sp.]
MKQQLKVQKVSAYTKRDMMGLVYIAPWIIGALLFQAYPFISSFIYSFSKYNIASFEWIGLENYKRLFTVDKDIINSIKVTFGYVFITVPGKLVIAMIVALILNQKLKAINLVRTIYYIPSLMGGSIAVAILWKLMFMSDGAINSVLSIIGIKGPNWLGNPSMALPTICLLEIWQFGSSMVLLLAALKQVPKELYEAAGVDGAGKWRTYWSITFPCITPILFFNLIMQTIQAFQNFTSAFVVTNGGPNKSTYVLGMKLYTEAFSNFKMGYASAVSWVMFVLIMIMTVVLFGSSKLWVHYDD